MKNISADIVVIGGGVYGASITYNLSKLGAGKVILLEKSFLASGATGRSGAMIREHYLHPTLAKMAKESKYIFNNFSEYIGGDSEFKQTGRILVFGEKDYDSVKLNVEMNRDLGIDISIISKKEVLELIPNINLDDIAISVWEPGCGYADPVATTYSFAKRAKDYGAEIFINTPAVDLIIENQRITGVKTDKGIIKTNTVINAAGAWGNLVGGFADELLPMNPLRVQMLYLRRPPSLDDLSIVVVDGLTNNYFREDNKKYTLIGGESIEDLQEIVDPNNFKLNIDHNKIIKFWNAIGKRIPDFKGAICKGGYSSLYDMTPDGNPILDKSDKVLGLYFAIGFSGHGFKLSPVVGKMMSEYVLNGYSNNHDINQFRLNRFKEDDMLEADYPYTDRGHP